MWDTWLGRLLPSLVPPSFVRTLSRLLVRASQISSSNPLCVERCEGEAEQLRARIKVLTKTPILKHLPVDGSSPHCRREPPC